MEDGKKKSTEAKSSGKPNYKIFSVIFADLLIVAIIADVYFMLYDIENIIPIIIMSVIVIVLATMLVLCILGIIGDNKKMNNAYYNNEMKAQRAIYLMMKKNHGVVEESQKSTGDVLSQLSREIVLNQKASSKIVVSRNKENTDALMNSNDIIIEKLVNLLAELKENQSVTAEQNERMSTIADAMSGQIDPASKDDIAAILEKLNAVSASLENGVQVAGTAAPLGNEGFEAEPDMEDFPDLDALATEEPVEDMEDLPDLDNLMPEEEPITDTEDTLDLDDFDLSGFEEDNGEVVLTGLDELMTEEAGNEEEDATEDLGDLDLDSLLSGLEDIPTDAEPAAESEPVAEEAAEPEMDFDLDALTAMAEDIPAVEEAAPEPVAEEAAEPEMDLDLDALAAMAEDIPTVEEPAAEPVAEEPAPEPVAEEPVPEPVAEEPAPEPVAEPEPAVAEEKPPMPDLSDPNKAMSPDEIAAMFANMAPADEAPAAEPEPEPVPEPVAEEPAPEPEPVPEPAVAEKKPPMPDLSDPNKAMSPDEIAAMFANMAPADEAPAPAPEPEPAPEPAPVPEMAATPVSMGDMNSNEKMTPEQIAELIANMGN